MTALRRAGLGLLTVVLLAVTAAAVGYALNHPTGPDLADSARQLATPVRAETTAEATPETTPDATPEPVETVEPAAPAPAAPVVGPVEPVDVPTPAGVRDELPDHPPTPGPPLLQRGDEGLEVRELQARLAALAWYSDPVDGTYGDATVAAVKGFQRKRGFATTGAVDARTQRRLEEMSGEPSRDAMGLHNVPGPLDPRCAAGRVLCVDKSTQTLRWVVDGQVRETLDVRFGASYTPTREGAFSVEWKSRDHVSSLYDSAMPFAMFFSGGQAVHYSSDFAARGYAGASHGCVNVRDHDAVAALYDEVQVGDGVVVYWS